MCHEGSAEIDDIRRVSLEEAWPVLQRFCPPVIDGRLATFEQVKAEVDRGFAVPIANRDGMLLLALEPGLDGRGDTLLVWCAVAAANGGKPQVGKYLPLVEQWAIGMGAKRIVMQSPRCGWLRRLPERWRVTNVTYELEVGSDVKPQQGHGS